MAPKAKTATPRRGNKQPAPVGIVVRRGALRRFDALIRKTAELPVVVSWDRRLADRRTSKDPARTDRRQADRRQAPPLTWDVADFVVVAEATTEPPQEPTVSRRKQGIAKAGTVPVVVPKKKGRKVS